jgi:large subunit ribosomal protein L25
MKTLEIIGFKRANLGKNEAKELRKAASVPCVMYGGKEHIHFHVPMFLFRDLVYTPKAHMVELNIEGSKHRCVLQEVQFHPVNEVILHADFLELHDDRPVKMNIPITFTGTAVGMQKGGKLTAKLTKLAVKALPNDLPDDIEVDVTALDLGKSIRVGEIEAKNYQILNNPLVTVATIMVPRALKGKTEEAADTKKAKK